MNNWKTDVAVLCIFFARPKQFAQCFEQVRRARPRVLLLWQDGPREGRPDDLENIMECRRIAENIDWECEVHRNYHDRNMGCDPSTFYSHQWAFSIVDKCIILEDDLVCSQSFFPFCKELLDQYENDERIDRICGTNLLGEYAIPNDYLFHNVGNSWGWASWRRVAQKWEADYAFLDDPYAVRCMRNLQPDVRRHLRWEKKCQLHKAEGIPYWEYIIGAQTLLNSRLVIYPRCNMVRNVGLDGNATHAPEDIKLLPRLVRRYFELETHELRFPLKHPRYVIRDAQYADLCDIRIRGTRIERIGMFFERVVLKLRKILMRKK
ncbi:MAG: hypothetical protein IJ422_00605 [Oscillospiraceae bacterium]|nr:hypothetical protein [Oscillospiraceae bacterium]